MKEAQPRVQEFWCKVGRLIIEMRKELLIAWQRWHNRYRVGQRTAKIERRRSELALKVSEEKFRNLVENTSDWIWEIDADGRYTYASPQIKKMLGYSPEEVIGKSPFDLMPEEEARRLKPLVETRIKQHERFASLENVNCHKDGRLVMLETSGVPFFHPDGTLAGYRGIDRDITKRKRAEDALRTSEIKHRTLLDNLTQKIFLKDRNSVYISCNENYARDLKIRPEQIAGKTDFEFYPKELAEKYRSDDKKIMESGKTEDVEEKYIQDGEERFVQTVKAPVRDEQGNVTGILGIFWDITERKKVEEALKYSEERFRTMFENAGGAVFIADIQTRVLVECNKHAEALIGRDRGEIIGMHQSKLHPEGEEEKYKTKFTQHVEKGRIFDHEGEVWHKDGRRIPVWISARTIKIKDKNVLMGLFIDITERKQAEEKLKEAYDKIKETQGQLIQAEKLHAVGQLASGVAHEVRNPLAIIMQGVNYMERKVSPQEKDAFEVLNMVKDSVRRADKIVNSLLDFSRLTGLNLQPEDISFILENSLDLVKTQIKFENIDIIQESAQDVPKILADKNKITQVFVNLFLNAVQAMPEGGRIIVRLYDKIFEKPGDGVGRRTEDTFKIGERAVIVEIEDSGVGIPEEYFKKVFDPFFTTKGPRQGSGLGLSVSRNIIETHKGLIDITSRVNRGTKVTVTLKIAGG